jgi:hypothetical protein
VLLSSSYTAYNVYERRQSNPVQLISLNVHSAKNQMTMNGLGLNAALVIVVTWNEKTCHNKGRSSPCGAIARDSVQMCQSHTRHMLDT